MNQILKHAVYQEEMEKIKQWEKDRIYCKHGLSHQLDVARIAYLISLEEKINLDKRLIYAAALLHDIGRGRQYEEGISHEKASIGLAKQILQDCAFIEEERKLILAAIEEHRTAQEEKEAGKEMQLNQLLYQADKKSRNCFACLAVSSCHWTQEKKNQEIFL